MLCASSYFEIYNERVRDLLPSKETQGCELRVREHPKDGPYVDGKYEYKNKISHLNIDSLFKLIKLLFICKIYVVQLFLDTRFKAILRSASWCRRATRDVPLPTQAWTMSAVDPTPSSLFALSRSQVHLLSAECHLPLCLYICADSCHSLKLSSPCLC